MQMSSAVLQHIVCVRVDGGGSHFVYSNCSKSENLPSKLHNIKLV